MMSSCYCAGDLDSLLVSFSFLYFLTCGSRELLVLMTSWTASILTFGQMNIICHIINYIYDYSPLFTFLILSLSSGQSLALPTPSSRSLNCATSRFSSSSA